jgi:hypothetical protein
MEPTSLQIKNLKSSVVVLVALIIGASIVLGAVILSSRIPRYQILVGNQIDYAVDLVTGRWWVLKDGAWAPCSSPAHQTQKKINNTVRAVTGSDPAGTRSGAE